MNESKPQNDESKPQNDESKAKNDESKANFPSIKKYIVSSSVGSLSGGNMEYQQLDKIMERENQKNRNEIWSKLDKTQKIQRLHVFAEKYGFDNGYTTQEIRLLKTFFSTCLEKGKLQKMKDIHYDKGTREIISIPALCIEGDGENRHFTLKNMDNKRVSTMKSLTPKRQTIIDGISKTI